MAAVAGGEGPAPVAPAPHTAVVVGGGIAGLATALALRRIGWSVAVLEQAPAFAEVGAGISLWPNALRALDALGVGPTVRAQGTAETVGGLRNRAGRWLARTIEAGSTRHERGILIHRAALVDILRSALTAADLKVGTRVESIRQTPGGATAVHRHGAHHAQLLVGADGLHSMVRTAVLPVARPPRYAGYTTWRFITPPIERRIAMTESWGRGERVGGGQFSDGRVYCYMTANLPAGGRGDELEELRRRFGHWHEPIPELLAAIAPDEVLRHDIYDLPPLPAFASGRVALVGDAAHAMTPDLGQGGCQALEDAVVLAASLRDSASVADGLSAYDRRRRPRAQAIARRSRLIGRLAQAAGPVTARVRDGLTAMLPAALMLRALEAPFDWDPPVLAAAR